MYVRAYNTEFIWWLLRAQTLKVLVLFSLKGISLKVLVLGLLQAISPRLHELVLRKMRVWCTFNETKTLCPELPTQTTKVQERTERGTNEQA